MTVYLNISSFYKGAFVCVVFCLCLFIKCSDIDRIFREVLYTQQ